MFPHLYAFLKSAFWFTDRFFILNRLNFIELWLSFLYLPEKSYIDSVNFYFIKKL